MGWYSHVDAVQESKPQPTRTSDRGQGLIHTFEGYRHTAYLDPVGVWTFGYGTTVSDGTPVQKGDRVIILALPRAIEKVDQLFS
jgi:hypothetical protein